MLQPHTVTIDTYAVIEALRANEKFTKEQAKAIVDTIRSVELYGVATSTDIQRLEKAAAEDTKRLEGALGDSYTP